MFARTIVVALAALFAALAVCGRSADAITDTDTEGRTPVADQGELTQLMSDHTFYGRYADGTNFTEYYAPDGRLAYWDGCPHSGRWWVDQGSEGAMACFRYPTMNPTGPHCFDVFRAPPSRNSRLEFLLVGSDPGWRAHAYTRAIRPGNPEDLSLTASGCQISRLFHEEKNG